MRSSQTKGRNREYEKGRKYIAEEEGVESRDKHRNINEMIYKTEEKGLHK